MDFLEELTVPLDLKANKELQALELRELKGQICPLDLSAQTALTEAVIRESGFTSVNFGDAPDLTKMTVYRMVDLATLNVTGCPALTELTVVETGISELDLTKNTELTHLRVEYSEISGLDLSQNTELVSLSLIQNRLVGLDLSHNTKLHYGRNGVITAGGEYTVECIVDDVLDLSTLPESFDISKVVVQDNGPYQFYLTNQGKDPVWASVGEDLLLSLDPNHTMAGYNYLVGLDPIEEGALTPSFPVTLMLTNRFYTVSCDTPGVTLKVPAGEDGGGNATVDLAKKAEAFSFTVELLPGYAVSPEGLTVTYLPMNGEETACGVREEADGTVYRVHTVNSPIAIRVDGIVRAEDLPPAGDDTPPAGDDTPPAGDDTPPAGDDTPPAGDDTPSAESFPMGAVISIVAGAVAVVGGGLILFLFVFRKRK